MRKQEVEAILGHEDVGPIEPYLEAIASEDALPVFEIGMCLLRMEEAGPPLRAVLERAAAGEELSKQEKRLLFRGIYMLGGARDTASFQPMVGLLRRPAAELDALFAHMDVSFARILIGMFDGNADALFEMIADGSVNSLVRAETLSAATFLTFNGNIPRERTQHLSGNSLSRIYSNMVIQPGTPG